MRLFLSSLVSALIVPLAAYAQAPKLVEVINDPLAVEVVNPAPPSPPVRWQLVGFTSATYTGAMGGHFGVTQKCQLEFPSIGSERKTYFPHRHRFFDPGVCSRSGWAVSS